MTLAHDPYCEQCGSDLVLAPEAKPAPEAVANPFLAYCEATYDLSEPAPVKPELFLVTNGDKSAWAYREEERWFYTLTERCEEKPRSKVNWRRAEA